MILVIDNYDSFVYNLVQYIGEIISGTGIAIKVYRNDSISVGEIARMNPQAIVVSPGPCTPKEAGVSVDAIKNFATKIPILGVCLGHQAIGAAFGAKIVRARRLMHGKTSLIKHDGKTIFKGLPNPFEATRYHSLAIERKSLPSVLEISAETSDGEIMGVRLKNKRMRVKGAPVGIVEGVQFHPESILTPHGKDILKNFLSVAGVL